MKIQVGVVVLLVLLAGCSAPIPDSTSAAPAPTTDAAPVTATHTPTSNTETRATGVQGEIVNTTVDDGFVISTLSVTNHDETAANFNIALRFVENDSHAKIGEFSLEPGQSMTRSVSLNSYADDPQNLTVQLRIDGAIASERAVV